MSKGISIECNPSSNKLIGTFDRYERHPIFRFNHIGLPRDEYPDENAELQVSINTDDQGVFDTSLENEYALLYGCLQMRKDQKGDSVMDLSTIREYLDQVRKWGTTASSPRQAVVHRVRRSILKKAPFCKMRRFRMDCISIMRQDQAYKKWHDDGLTALLLCRSIGEQL